MEPTEAFIAKKFKPKDGPHYQSLSEALDELSVEWQAYHGGSFVGNHVHKLLQVKYSHTTTNNSLLIHIKQPESINILLSTISAVAPTVTSVASETSKVVDKFKRAFNLFGKCHRAYNGRVLDDATIHKLG